MWLKTSKWPGFPIPRFAIWIKFSGVSVRKGSLPWILSNGCQHYWSQYFANRILMLSCRFWPSMRHSSWRRRFWSVFQIVKNSGPVFSGNALTEKSSEIYGIIDHAESSSRSRRRVSEQMPMSQKFKLYCSLFKSVAACRSCRKIGCFRHPRMKPSLRVNELLLVLDLLESTEIGQSVHDIFDYPWPRFIILLQIFETLLPEYKNLVPSGGRYDNLASGYTEENSQVSVFLGLLVSSTAFRRIVFSKLINRSGWYCVVPSGCGNCLRR